MCTLPIESILRKLAQDKRELAEMLYLRSSLLMHKPECVSGLNLATRKSPIGGPHRKNERQCCDLGLRLYQRRQVRTKCNER